MKQLVPPTRSDLRAPQGMWRVVETIGDPESAHSKLLFTNDFADYFQASEFTDRPPLSHTRSLYNDQGTRVVSITPGS